MRTITTFIITFVMGLSLNAQSSEEENFGNNRLAIAPFMAYGSSSIDDIGVGLAYEHYLNPKVAFQSDVSFGLNNEMLQFMIGPKFYPRDHDKPLSYAISPVLFVTQAEEVIDRFFAHDPPASYIETRNHRQFGFMLINSVNMSITEQFYFGLEAGLGINYINRYDSNRLSGLSENDTNSAVLFRLSTGYRF